MKKNLLLTVIVLLSVSLWGQGNSGLGFNYQAVVRGADGFVLPRQSVELRFSLMPGQQATEASWIETHQVTTDDYGTVGMVVGKGTKAGGVAATFKDVNFAAVYYWLKVEIKENSAYRELSYTALTSVPYAEAAGNAAGVPSGTIVPYAGETIPQGWLLCDGSAVSRTEYANLYAAIKTAWGHGDNATTFNLPDLRGMFLRGVSRDSGTNTDADSRIPRKEGGNSGNNVGSYQGDAIRNITGGFLSFDRASNTYNEGIYSIQSRWSTGVRGGGSADNWGTIMKSDASRVVPVGADNRPQNVYVNYIIKS